MREYPLAASTINIVAYVVRLLSLPAKSLSKPEVREEMPSKSFHKLAQMLGFPITSTMSDALFSSPSPLHRIICLPSSLSPMEQLYDLSSHLLCLVDILFASVGAGYMQFPLVFAEASERCAIGR